MADRDDIRYYARRATVHRALAATTHAAEIRRIHLDLATSYAERAGAPEATGATLRVVR